MTKMQCAFAGSENLPLPITTSPQKGPVKCVILAHEHWLVDSLAKELAKHVEVVPLIREIGVVDVVSEAEVRSAMEGATMLMVAPCRASMVQRADIHAIEKYAVNLAS